MTTDPRTNVPLILLLWIAGLGAAGQYAKISVIFDQLAAHYPDTGPAGLGFVVSIVGVPGILLGAFAGRFVSGFGYRRSLIRALWAGAVLSLVQASLPPLWIMLALRVLEGLSHLVIVVAIPTLIAQVSSPTHRGFALTLWSTFFSVAFTLLVAFGLPLVAWGGIPALFLLHAGWLAACALALGPALRRLVMPAPAAPGRVTTGASLRREISDLYRSPFICAPAVGWLFYTLVFLSLLTLLPQVLPAENRAFVIGAMPMVSIGVSLSLGVWLMRRTSAVVAILTGFACAALVTLALIAFPGSTVLCLALAGALGLVQGATFAAVPELNDALADRARANGALAQMGNLGNTLGTPVLAGILTATGASGMMFASAILLCFGVVAHLALARARSHVKNHRGKG